MRRTAHREGIDAGKVGDLRVSNPYPFDDKDYEKWDAGWIAGVKDARLRIWKPIRKSSLSQTKIETDKSNVSELE